MDGYPQWGKSGRRFVAGESMGPPVLLPAINSPPFCRRALMGASSSKQDTGSVPETRCNSRHRASSEEA